MTRRRRERGFTLVEMAVALLILALSTAIAAPSIRSGMERVEARSVTRKLAAAMAHARVLALRNSETYLAEGRGGGLVVRAEGSMEPVVEIKGSHARIMPGGAVAFYPGGHSSGGSFTVAGPGEKASYMVEVEPSTGRATVKRADKG